MSASPHPITIAIILLSSLALLSGCKSNGGNTEKLLAMNQLSSGRGGELPTLNLSSPSFDPGQRIPVRFTADGGNVSPALQWSAGLAATKEYVLIVEDPDAPTPTPWVHWVALRIPGGATGLPEDSGKSALVGQGKNTTGNTGYFGPKPPPGSGHRYFFQLFALNAPLGLDDGATRDEVVKAMSGRIVAQGSVMGTFKSSK
jgi:Raf kinase inhibitor-like YbhB/YbcL family protein